MADLGFTDLVHNVCVLLLLLTDYADDQSVLGELFLTLSKLAVRNEFCQDILELGGLDLMLQALGKSMDNQASEVTRIQLKPFVEHFQNIQSMSLRYC